MCEMRDRSLVGGTLVALVAVIALAGCGSKTQSGPAAPQPPAAQAPQPAPATPPAQPPATQPATPAPAPPTPSTPPAAPVVAKADGEASGTRVEVQELKRSANTVMLRFAVINESQKSFNLGLWCGILVGPDAGTASCVNLVDAAGKKKYLTIHDSEGHCVCSGGLGELAPGDRINLWAKFPAPPATVQKITVVVPHFIPMDDVPISQ